MAAPKVPIEVDPETGVWTTDGLPMLYVPRHFLINNHLAVEAALGRDAYARLLYQAGYESAYTWCEQEAATHGLEGEAVFRHYMRRLSQRGWGRFTVEELSPGVGSARVRVEHSCFVYHLGNERPAADALCYMFAGWFPGALAWVAQNGVAKNGVAKNTGTGAPELTCGEVACAAGGGASHCLFEVTPRVTPAP